MGGQQLKRSSKSGFLSHKCFRCNFKHNCTMLYHNRIECTKKFKISRWPLLVSLSNLCSFGPTRFCSVQSHSSRRSASFFCPCPVLHLSSDWPTQYCRLSLGLPATQERLVGCTACSISCRIFSRKFLKVYSQFSEY